MPFFGEEEKSHLAHDGKPNVKIIYNEFYNPVTEKIEYRIKNIDPVYALLK